MGAIAERLGVRVTAAACVGRGPGAEPDVAAQVVLVGDVLQVAENLGRPALAEVADGGHHFLGTIDLMWVWYLIVLAIGLGLVTLRLLPGRSSTTVSPAPAPA